MIRKALRLSAAPAFAAAIRSRRAGAGTVVNVYNWSDYIDEVDHRGLHQGDRHQGRLRRLRFQRDPRDQAARRRHRLRHRRADRRNFLARQIQAGVFQKLDKSKLPNLSNMWDVVAERLANYDPGNEYSDQLHVGHDRHRLQRRRRSRKRSASTDRQLGRVLQAGEVSPSSPIAASMCSIRRPT